ncbi:MAG: ribbon-helix-helix protein, CopG family [Candidatus Eisenbacteria sp.]|nr:ribbon-helix-helix protein, CopG family [Candidatus Eisenbacteria bacterium]
MKTAISLPDAMFEAVERMARRLGISRSQLFQHAVQQYLKDHHQAGVTEALDDVYANDPSTSRLSPMLNKLQIASLPKEDW